ncbi:hypothetical protein GGD50_004748 [Rhizobium paranaense]|uniref:Uncharacterized protein n=1 Tax=Rhizobium paranaense TaxID=1650438 RepID=A0A7W8XV13_9HYPH|nr:hypothetical protein [Rhizobium paranaense]
MPTISLDSHDAEKPVIVNPAEMIGDRLPVIYHCRARLAPEGH